MVHGSTTTRYVELTDKLLVSNLNILLNIQLYFKHV